MEIITRFSLILYSGEPEQNAVRDTEKRPTEGFTGNRKPRIYDFNREKTYHRPSFEYSYFPFRRDFVEGFSEY